MDYTWFIKSRLNGCLEWGYVVEDIKMLLLLLWLKSSIFLKRFLNLHYSRSHPIQLNIAFREPKKKEVALRIQLS